MTTLEILKTKRAYLSGPMSGYPEFNFPAFAAACADLREHGWLISSPHEKGSETPDADYLTLLREDGRMLLDVDAIILLPGWPASNGARWELQIALGLNLKVYFYVPGNGLVDMNREKSKS